jgi:hypothetical protein
MKYEIRDTNPYLKFAFKRKIVLTHTRPSPEGTVSSALGEAQGAGACSLSVHALSQNLCAYALARKCKTKIKTCCLLW